MAASFDYLIGTTITTLTGVDLHGPQDPNQEWFWDSAIGTAPANTVLGVCTSVIYVPGWIGAFGALFGPQVWLVFGAPATPIDGVSGAFKIQYSQGTISSDGTTVTDANNGIINGATAAASNVPDVLGGIFGTAGNLILLLIAIGIVLAILFVWFNFIRKG